jgi:hypothetical protein
VLVQALLARQSAQAQAQALEPERPGPKEKSCQIFC